MTITDQERLALRDALAPITEHGGGLSPWNYGSTTIGRLKKRGLIEPVTIKWTDPSGNIRKQTVYRATEAGRAELGVQENPLTHTSKIVAIGVGIGTLAVAGAAAIAYASNRVSTVKKKVERVALVGDSLAVGLGPEMAKLAKADGTEFRYYGKSGTTAKGWVENKWADPAVEFAPELFFVSLGANDFGYSPAPPRAAYEQLRDQLRATGARVIWIEPLGTKMKGPISVIESLGVEVVPQDASVPLASDGVHAMRSDGWAKTVWQHVRDRS